jgi:hypothetical protein
MSQPLRSRRGRFRRRQTRRGDRTSSGGTLESVFVDVTPPKGQDIVQFKGEYMPKKLVNYMQYSEVWNITTAGGAQGYVYKMNSVYDPFSGAGGNACYGIDELSAIYDRYRVLDTRIVVTATNQAVESSMLYVFPTNDSTTPTATISRTAPERKSVMLAQYFPQTLTIKTSTSKWLMNNRDYDASAASNADPAKLAYFGLFTKNFTAAALNAIISVTIYYHTEWSVRKAADDTDD